MPNTQAPEPMTVKNLMAAVKQLSPAELREFERQLAEWQGQNGGQEKSEAELIEETRLRLPAADQKRLKRLIAKSERGALTTEEWDNYRALAQRAEEIDVKRAEALAELVRRRGKPARTVMKEIGWASGSDGV